MEFTFSLSTKNIFLSIKDFVPPSNVVVEYEHLKSFQISGNNCIVKDILKTKLINESFTTQCQLE